MAETGRESERQHQNNPASIISPMSPHGNRVSEYSGADAPEVVESSATPSTLVVSPATAYSRQSDVENTAVNRADDSGKEAVQYDDTEKIAIPTAYEYQHSPYPQVVGDPDVGGKLETDAERAESGRNSSPEKQSPNTILGLKKKTFYILLAVALVVIVAAAVGGGVGGSQGSKKSDSNTAAGAATSSSR